MRCIGVFRDYRMCFLQFSIKSFKQFANAVSLLIGFSLVGEGLELHIPKGYIYFAMGFSVFVEFLNMRVRRKTVDPLKLRRPKTVPVKQ